MDLPVNFSTDRDAARAARIPAFGPILEALREIVGLGFAAIDKVADGVWIPVAISDGIGLGERVGEPIPASETLCELVAELLQPIFIDRAGADAVHGGHRCFGRWNVQCYAGTPIVLEGGVTWGTLCGMNREPAEVDNPRTRALFKHFAKQIGSEIDGQRRAETALRELLDERAGGESRERFIAILGHDLRNPLSSILASASVIKIKSADPVVVNLADRVVDNVGRMAAMVSDLLDTARGRQAGGIEVADEPIEDIGTAVESVVDELRTAHPGREIVSRIAVGKPVAGDRRRLQQLTSNLVANALEHGSDRSPIEVRVSTSGDALSIEVRNEGAPIPLETMPGLFDAYSHRGRGDGKPREGLGLGLYICEQIAKAHGGRISVSSTHDGGTCFTATMPLQRGAATPG